MQIPCCVAQWTIWHFCPHTKRALLIIYCPTIVNYGNGWPWSRKKSNASRTDWIELEWTRVKWSLELGAFSFLSSGIFVWGFEPVERHSIWGIRDRRRLHFTSGFRFRFRFSVFGLVLVWASVSVSEMLRLISCHKPNDKTYFRGTTKCARAPRYYCQPIGVYLWRGHKMIQHKNQKLKLISNLITIKIKPGAELHLWVAFDLLVPKVCHPSPIFSVGVPRKKARPHPEIPRKFEINL